MVIALYKNALLTERVFLAGRAGFEPAVELFTRQPLSRRPQSATLAPPHIQLFARIGKAEGVGFEPTWACTQPVFKTGTFVHSVIPPSGGILP